MPASEINDGNWTVATVCGEPKYEYPFADQGDVATYVVTFKMRQDWRNFTALASMTVISTALGNGYLVESETTTPIGQGLVEWERVVANVPASRTRPSGTMSYSLQILITVASVPAVPYEIEELPLTIDTYTTWDYSTSTFAVVQAPHIFSTCRGLILVNIGSWGVTTAGDPVLAMDSENSIYRGLIYCRKKTYITQPFTNTGE